jgi:hypothetical protein
MKAEKPVNQAKLENEGYGPPSSMNFSDGITNEDVHSISYIMSQSIAAVIESSSQHRISK